MTIWLETIGMIEGDKVASRVDSSRVGLSGICSMMKLIKLMLKLMILL